MRVFSSKMQYPRLPWGPIARINPWLRRQHSLSNRPDPHVCDLVELLLGQARPHVGGQVL